MGVDTRHDRDEVSSPGSRKPLVEIRDYVEEDYGIHFDRKKLYSLEHKLNRRLRSLSLDSLSDYLSYLKTHSDEIHKLLDEVSTNKTAFFREPKHWDFLIDDIFPDWKRTREPIKAWSVPASSGEEPYSLAMVIDDYLRNRNHKNHVGDSGRFKILASDVSRKVLQATRRGIYTQKRLDQVRDFDRSYPDKYFNEEEPGKYCIDDVLKQMLTLRTFNLNTAEYPIEESFNLILCRNVLIYFENDVIEHVINQLTKCLKPGGYLFIGHTESLHDVQHDLVKVKPSIFQRP